MSNIYNIIIKKNILLPYLEKIVLFSYFGILTSITPFSLSFKLFIIFPYGEINAEIPLLVDQIIYVPSSIAL